METEMIVLLQELSKVWADKLDTGAVDHSSFVAGSFLAGSFLAGSFLAGSRMYVSADSEVVWWVGRQ
jgi:hypothetical protein